jgi:hypothetical protein
MRRHVEPEWVPNEIIHSSRMNAIFGDLVRKLVKELSLNCKNLSTQRWVCSSC